MRTSMLLIATLCLMTTLPAAAQPVEDLNPLLVEIQPNPEGPDRGNEWVEFANPFPVPLDLDGFYLADGERCLLADEGRTADDRYPLEGTIPAFDRLVILLPSSCLQLANTGDNLNLTLEDGTLVQEISWPQENLDLPAEQETLQACLGTAGLHGNWTLAQATPGEANVAC